MRDFLFFRRRDGTGDSMFVRSKPTLYGTRAAADKPEIAVVRDACGAVMVDSRSCVGRNHSEARKELL